MLNSENFRGQRPASAEYDLQERHIQEVEVALALMDEMLAMSAREGRASQTGYRIASAMKYEDGRWTYGLNDERVSPFLHAEVDALSRRPSDALLTHVYLVGAGGKGPLDGLKHAIPCENCSHAIEPVAVDGATVTLFTQGIAELGGLRLGNPYRFSDIRAAYIGYDDVPFRREESVDEFLAANTKVVPADRRVLSRLNHQLGMELGTNYQLYLTGSATGRGGPKGLVAAGLIGVPYGDMDLVLITPTTVVDLDKSVRIMYEQALREEGVEDAVLVEEVVPYLTEHQLNEHPDTSGLHARVVYTHGKAFGEGKLVFPQHYMKELKPSGIDVTFGNDLQEVMTPEYLQRNWYLRIT